MEYVFGALYGIVDDLWPPERVQGQDGEEWMYRKGEGEEKYEENDAVEAKMHRHETSAEATPTITIVTTPLTSINAGVVIIVSR